MWLANKRTITIPVQVEGTNMTNICNTWLTQKEMSNNTCHTKPSLIHLSLRQLDRFGDFTTKVPEYKPMHRDVDKT